MTAIPRMRTMKMLHKEIHLLDNNSQVTKNFIRKVIITKKVKSVKAGSKYLVNLDEFLEYLANPTDDIVIDNIVSYGNLRKIDT
jgi:hypothetical protein